jgi:hypothetical protein
MALTSVLPPIRECKPHRAVRKTFRLVGSTRPDPTG